MLTSHPIKFGVTRDLSENIAGAAGPDVGVAYSVSDPGLLAVDASGVVSVIYDVSVETRAAVYGTNTATGDVYTCDVQVFPSSVDIDALVNADGTPKGVTVSLGYPVSL